MAGSHDTYMFKIVNLSPLIVNRGSGNYMKSTDYIPASSLIGAFTATQIDPKCFGKEKKLLDFDIALTDAMPVGSILNEEGSPQSAEGSLRRVEELNPPSLVTISGKNPSEGDQYFDCARILIEYSTSKKPVDYEPVRLKKGPRFWRVEDNHIKTVNLSEPLGLTLLTLDDYTLTAYTKYSGEEKTGLLAHVQSIPPGHLFVFEVSGNKDEVERLRSALSEGLYVGGLRSKGYGLVKLVDSRLTQPQQKRALKVEGDSDDYYVLSVYGNLDQAYLLKVKKELEDGGSKLIYANIGEQEVIRLDYDVFKKRRVVRSGSVLIYTNIPQEKVYNLERESLEKGKGGKIIVNHKVHWVN
ncbi:MAG: hypothetical protein QW429_02210 [Thermoprotei archaeon]